MLVQTFRQAHPNQPLWLVSGQVTQQMHHETQENIWLLVSIVVCVHDGFVIASQMSWHQSEVAKQSHQAHQKWSFWLALGQMTVQMHRVTQKF